MMQKSEEIEATAQNVESVGKAEVLDDKETPMVQVDLAHDDEYPVKLSWRSWLVVFIICFV